MTALAGAPDIESAADGWVVLRGRLALTFGPGSPEPQPVCRRR